MKSTANFSIGQLVEHKLFNYRGVIYEVDPEFMLSEQWYEQVAKTRPPKNEPWYHVLVSNAYHTTYVAQQNLIASQDLSPIQHPELSQWFDDFVDGKYLPSHNRVQ